MNTKEGNMLYYTIQLAVRNVSLTRIRDHSTPQARGRQIWNVHRAYRSPIAQKPLSISKVVYMKTKLLLLPNDYLNVSIARGLELTLAV